MQEVSKISSSVRSCHQIFSRSFFFYLVEGNQRLFLSSKRRLLPGWLQSVRSENEWSRRILWHSGTSLLRHLQWGKTKFGPGKNVHIIFAVVITSIEETPLSRPGTKGHFCWVPKPWFNLPFSPVDTLALKTWLTTKILDNFKFTLASHNEDSFQNTNYLK